MTWPTQRLALRITAFIGALAVGLGAFGAHALKTFLEQQGRAETWHTAVLYHLVHAVALLVLAVAGNWRPRVWLAFASGVAVFSGSLYLLCLTSAKWLGALTPLGGVALIAGWVLLAFDRNRRE